MLQHKLERLFSYKKTILFILLLLTLLFAYNLKNIQVNFDFNPKISKSEASDLEKLFAVKSSDKQSNISNLITIVAYDQQLFSAEKLQVLKNFEQQLLKNDAVMTVDSLYSIPDMNNYFITESIKPMLSGHESLPKELEYVRYQATHNKLLLNRFVNPRGTAMAFHVVLKPANRKELVKNRNEIESVVKRYHVNFNKLYQISGLEVENYLARVSLSDSLILGSAALLILVLIYGFFFQKITMGLLPLITSSLALVWTGGVLAYFNIPINALSIVVFIMVFVVGAMECAHFINAYQRSWVSDMIITPFLLKKLNITRKLL